MDVSFSNPPVAKGFFRVVIVLFYSPEGLVVTVPPLKQCFCLAYLSKKQLINVEYLQIEQPIENVFAYSHFTGHTSRFKKSPVRPKFMQE